jgi:DNA-binding transcriptional MerR regulator
MTAELTVGRVAELAGVTVRTLHHYDEIGLVSPSGRTAGGYRSYEAEDIERLSRVLTYRRLDFSLEQIAALLDDPEADETGHLLRQRELLLQRGERLAAMVAAIDRELEARKLGMRLTPEEQLEVFGTDKIGGEWADEAEQRWGETDAYQESQRRTARYTKADWERLKAESDSGLRAFADAMAAGVDPVGVDGMALAEDHRAFLCKWFYECSYDVHRDLAEMYVSDERFTATFEVVAPGLAGFVHDAIVANAEAHQV